VILRIPRESKLFPLRYGHCLMHHFRGIDELDDDDCRSGG
jgi:hypothetical protein